MITMSLYRRMLAAGTFVASLGLIQGCGEIAPAPPPLPASNLPPAATKPGAEAKPSTEKARSTATQDSTLTPGLKTSAPAAK